MSWFQTGDEKLPEKEERTGLPMGDFRFFLALTSPPSRAVVAFITDEPFRIYEHEIWIGKRPYYFSCAQEYPGRDKCEICEAGLKGADRQHVGFFSCIQVGETKSKDGTKTYKNPRRILPAKTDSMKKIKNWRETRKCIVGAEYDVIRLKKEGAKIGDDWQFKTGIEMETEDGVARSREDMLERGRKRLVNRFGEAYGEKGDEPASKAHDWPNLLKPVSPEEMLKVVKKINASAQVQDSAGSPDQIPF